MTVQYLGIVDDVNSCSCCGKTGLKHTVAIDFDGETRYYGVVCAGNALGVATKTPADIKVAVDRRNAQEKIEREVQQRRDAGENVVYGRFYYGRSYKTRQEIAAPSDQMVSQIYPQPNAS